VEAQLTFKNFSSKSLKLISKINFKSLKIFTSLIINKDLHMQFLHQIKKKKEKRNINEKSVKSYLKINDNKQGKNVYLFFVDIIVFKK